MDYGNEHIGSSFDDFLKEEGIYEESHEIALKRVLVWQIAQEMKAQHITKSKMAERMHTSRTQVERLLDPKRNSVQLDTLQRAAGAIGRRLVVNLEEAIPPARPNLPGQRKTKEKAGHATVSC
jgi:antitoxin HicB